MSGRRTCTPIFARTEPGRVTRTRMAETITRHVTGGGSISEDDLLRAGFSRAEIERHYRAALDRAGVKRLEDTL